MPVKVAYTIDYEGHFPFLIFGTPCNRHLLLHEKMKTDKSEMENLLVPAPARLATDRQECLSYGSHGDGALKRATRVQVFEKIAFMRLVPTDLARGNRTDVQPVDVRRGK